jgi:hypothetical protein
MGALRIFLGRAVRDVEREAWIRRAVCRIQSTCVLCGGLQELELAVFGAWGVCVQCKYPERLLWWRTDWTPGQ